MAIIVRINCGMSTWARTADLKELIKEVENNLGMFDKILCTD